MTAATRFEELIAWQRSAELRDEIIKLTQTGKVSRDLDFSSQIRDASSSAPRNLAEGFGYFEPAQFAKYARIARASLMETRNHLQDGETRGYFSAEDTRRMLDVCRRAVAATSRLLRYLDSCYGQAPTGWKGEANRKQRNDQRTQKRNR